MNIQVRLDRMRLLFSCRSLCTFRVSFWGRVSGFVLPYRAHDLMTPTATRPLSRCSLGQNGRKEFQKKRSSNAAINNALHAKIFRVIIHAVNFPLKDFPSEDVWLDFYLGNNEWKCTKCFLQFIFLLFMANLQFLLDSFVWLFWEKKMSFIYGIWKETIWRKRHEI